MLLEAYRLYTHPKLIAVFFLGFASGLPLALTASTLSIWLAENGVDKAAIGMFAAVGTPYTLKFLWAPLMDGTQFPVLGRLFGHRRGWLFATQIGLIFSLIALGFSNPLNGPYITALLAVLVAICSASQDIVIDAYRVELLEPEQQAAGAATVVMGYRLGMVISGAGALYLATYFGWQITYAVMAACMGVGIITALLAGEPERHSQSEALQSKNMAQWLREAVIEPFAEFMTREKWRLILLFILLYKLADAFMGMMTYPFYLEMGFEKTEIANVAKLYGILATIIGSLIGGALLYKAGMYKSLWICGILHGVSNLMFVAQAKIGADVGFLALTISVENISGGMGTAIFVAYISSLCNLKFTATQYALLSSLSAFGRTWLSTPAGFVVEKLGWELFFILAALLAIPGLVLLWMLKSDITANDAPEKKRG